MYNTLLVAVDDSPVAFAAAEHACRLAKKLGAKVRLLSVVAFDPFVGVNFYQVAPVITDYLLKAEEHAQGILAELEQTFKREQVAVDSEIIRGQDTAKEICDYAAQHQIDLIIMGSHGRKGVERMLLGSTAQRVLTTAQVPVLVIKATPK